MTLPMKSLKVVFVGETRVGKSSILSRYVSNVFSDDTPATIGAAFLTKVVDTEQGQLRLQLWDTAGQEKFRTLAPMYYRASAVAVLVYDVTSEASFVSMSSWLTEILSKAPQNIRIVVIGNKCDSTEDRVISYEMGEEYSKKVHAAYFSETSAKTGQGINELFLNIAKIELQCNELPEKGLIRMADDANRPKASSCDC